MKYLTKKRLNKLFRPSKKVEAKKVILFNSLDNVSKQSKTPSDVVHNLIKWSFSNTSIFTNSKYVVSRVIKASHITLKNGDHVPHVSSAYTLFKNGKNCLRCGS